MTPKGIFFGGKYLRYLATQRIKYTRSVFGV